MARVKAVFFIPVRDNDGRHLRAEITALETGLYATFVGWTMTGTVKGMYQLSDRRPAYDICKAYMIVMDEERVPELESLLREFKAKTTQEAIYLEIQHDVDVRFI
jgi:hypothetical protein